jgi:hypothetical protein
MHYPRRRSNLCFAWLVALAALLCRPALADQVVDFDHDFDFSTVRTFTFRSTTMGIDLPETRNDIVVSSTTQAIRKALLARGLQELAQDADVHVDWNVFDQAMLVGPGGQARPTGYGQGGRWSNGMRDGQQPTFIESTLVLDITASSSGLLIFRGVHRNRDQDAAYTAKMLPEYARKLVDGYPRARK